MDVREEKKIRQWQKQNHQRMRIRFIKSRTPRDDDFSKFVEQLQAAAPEITVKAENADTEPAPALHIGDRIVYQAVPLGPELDPFLQAMTYLQTSGEILPRKRKSNLNALRMPVLLKLYIAPHCPYCPVVVQNLIALAAASELVRLTIIDGALFPESVEADKIQSAPTLLLDTFRFTGNIDPDEITAVMVNRNPADLSADTLRSIIHEGGASEVAGMMLAEDNIFKPFINLLTHEKWPVRLGAMVVMEELIETDKALAKKAVGLICEALKHSDESVQGDMAYILGEIGDPSVLPLLEELAANTRNPELKTAVGEALAAIQIANETTKKTD